MQTMVQAGADKIWAEDSGGDGPALVLLHEHVADSWMWDPIWPQLTAACAAWCCSAPFVTELARSAARASAGQERFQQEDAPAFGRLDEISVPSVIMVGDLDHPALIDSNEQAAARIPGCTLIRMPGVDHYPTVRAPGLVLDTIRKYCPAPL